MVFYFYFYLKNLLLELSDANISNSKSSCPLLSITYFCTIKYWKSLIHIAKLWCPCHKDQRHCNGSGSKLEEETLHLLLYFAPRCDRLFPICPLMSISCQDKARPKFYGSDSNFLCIRQIFIARAPSTVLNQSTIFPLSCYRCIQGSSR